MLYQEYIRKAKEVTIAQHDNGLWYLIPEWKYMLTVNNLVNVKIRDFRTNMIDIEDTLKLEVESRNAKESKRNAVINWIYDTITATVEPAILQEETDYIKNVMDYLKLNHELQNTSADAV